MPGVGGVNGPVFAGDNVAEDARANAAGGAMGNAAAFAGANVVPVGRE